LAAADPSSDYNPFALPPVAPASTDGSLAPRGPEPVARAEGPAARSAPAEAPPAPAAEEPPATNPPAPPGSRKKWGDLASLGKPPIVVEPTSARVAARPRREASRDRDKDPAIALCDYDPRLRKLKDFRLPDLDGKPVRFQDLDADYILLDFWGTWCTPCLDSVPHLVDLQKQYGPSRLRVVGIACENIAPEKRKARVDEYTRKLNINYAVLLSGMNGPCPLLEAFQVQVFPTMILLNRRGEVLWRESGSKPPTMARLDRVLASSTRGDTVRR
jgi:thiol-disulfide isomerase/thioredoxin